MADETMTTRAVGAIETALIALDESGTDDNIGKASAASAALTALTVLLAAQANEPRAIIRHFAAAMERKLAANDGVKGGWKQDNWTSLYAGLGIEKDELLDALTKRQKVLMALDGVTVEWENGQLLSQVDAKEDELLRLLDEANKAVLLEAADCANYLMLIADVVGALPPTDERGR